MSSEAVEAVLRHSQSRGPARLLLLCIAHQVEPGEVELQITLPALEVLTKIERRQIQRLLKHLVEDLRELSRQVGASHQPSTYRLRLPFLKRSGRGLADINEVSEATFLGGDIITETTHLGGNITIQLGGNLDTPASSLDGEFTTQLGGKSDITDVYPLCLGGNSTTELGGNSDIGISPLGGNSTMVELPPKRDWEEGECPLGGNITTQEEDARAALDGNSTAQTENWMVNLPPNSAVELPPKPEGPTTQHMHVVLNEMNAYALTCNQTEDCVEETAELLCALQAEGVKETVAVDLVHHAVYRSRVSQQLTYLDARAPRNRAATLVASIKGDWEAPAALRAGDDPQKWDKHRAKAQTPQHPLAQRFFSGAFSAKERLATGSQASESARDVGAEGNEEEGGEEADNARLDALYDALPIAEKQRLDVLANERLGILGRLGKAQAALLAMRRNLLRGENGMAELNNQPLL